MAETSKIEWTDATWNPVTGCKVLSPGCTNCYAMRLAGTRLRNHASRQGLTQDSNAGPVWTGEVRLNKEWLEQPLNWKTGRRIFAVAHGDLFHEDVPQDWIDWVLAVASLADQHTIQILTKRAGRMRRYFEIDPKAPMTQIPESRVAWLAKEIARERGEDVNHPYWDVWWDWPHKHIHLGVSVEDQTRADERIPDLQQTPAGLRFLSCEPLLGPLDLYRGGWSFLHNTMSPSGKKHPRVDWVIVGGESGPNARDMNPDWARSIRDQCREAGVPFFMKQMAHKAPIPEDLQIRELPEPKS